MNFVQVTEVLYEAFAAGWTGTAAGTVEYENTNFKPPTDATPWVKFSVIETRSPIGQRTMGPTGGRRFDRRGNVMLQAFAPAEGLVTASGGAGPALTIAELGRAFFEGKTISPAKFHDATVGRARLAPQLQGRWFTVLVTCPFYFQETK